MLLLYLFYLLHLLRISFIISFKISSFESIDYDEVKEIKEIFGDNKIMYQFSEAIDTGVRRVFPLMAGSMGRMGRYFL